MKKLFVLFAFVLAAALSYGQDLSTLNAVGSGIFNNGGDSKAAAYDKINLAIARINTSGIITTEVTLDSAELCGSAAGAIGHTSGAVLVAAPGTGYALEFISAVLIWDYSTAAYEGGANDAVIRSGTVAQTDTILDARWMKATNDSVYVVQPIAAASTNIVENGTINIKGTTFTDPGTAQGEARIQVRYRRITTGL